MGKWLVERGGLWKSRNLPNEAVGNKSWFCKILNFWELDDKLNAPVRKPHACVKKRSNKQEHILQEFDRFSVYCYDFICIQIQMTLWGQKLWCPKQIMLAVNIHNVMANVLLTKQIRSCTVVALRRFPPLCVHRFMWVRPTIGVYALHRCLVYSYSILHVQYTPYSIVYFMYYCI